LSLVVGRGSCVCARGSSVVTASDRLAVSVVVEGTVGSGSVRSCNSGAGHVGVMTWAVVTSTRSKSSMAGGGGRNSGDFRITKLVVTLLALPELGAGTASVVVGRSRAEALLLLVVTSEKNLYRNGEKEEESGKG